MNALAEAGPTEVPAQARDAAETGPLLMLRFIPDMTALGRWVATTGQRALRDDAGYALHAVLRATLGECAPKPFALLQRPGSGQLIGYSSQPLQALMQAIKQGPITDPGAARALGLDRPGDVVIKPMPSIWASGQMLSFEARVAPIVRSRSRSAAGPGGAYPEIDAAFHPEFALDTPGDRAAAHGRWLAKELARGGAATLQAHRAVAFQLAPMARRNHRAQGGPPQRAPRDTHNGLLPDLTVRGQLRVDDACAFNHLLARGLGRHRSFGFGCLLLAPAGAWS